MRRKTPTCLSVRCCGGGGGGCGRGVAVVVCRLLNVPATCYSISGTDLLRQFYVLPHWVRSCRSSFLPHPVTVYWHRTNHSRSGARLGSHWSANFKVTGMTRPRKIPTAQAGIELFRSRGGRLIHLANEAVQRCWRGHRDKWWTCNRYGVSH